MAQSLKFSALNELNCKKLLDDMSSSESVFGAKKWLNLIKVRGMAYLQMDKSVPLNDLLVICEEAIKNLN